MSQRLVLYSRSGCCLCEEMKAIVHQVGRSMPFSFEEIDVDRSIELQQKYGLEVPVLFINGRKAFKYRLTAKQLKTRLRTG